MTSSAKLTLTSKKPREECSKVISRKLVKDCYCHSEVNKVHLRLSRSLHKPTLPCCNCRSLFEFKPIKETDDKTTMTAPINCETFKRVQKIDYTPRSQFLRNVKSKVCELKTGDQGDCIQTCPRLSNYCKVMPNARMQDISYEKLTLSDERKHFDEKLQKSPTSSTQVPANSLASEQHDSDRDNVSYVFNRKTQTSAQKLLKSTLRKTIRCKKYQQIPKSSQRSKSPIQTKKITLKQDCSCCYLSELEKETRKFCSDELVEKHKLPKYYNRRDRCLKHDEDDFAVDDSVNQEIKDLKKFREQNYFETHGSNCTLTLSKSSGSLQQYFLNERLFPEPIGKIHRQDLVVTMPPCTTTQKKRIHYFPRYVIRQEKKICNDYRRKKCQGCPLTGHAIDLGILKTRPLLNSLALKYQKRNF